MVKAIQVSGTDFRTRMGGSRSHISGVLIADSEGLLLLTDDGRLQARIANPKHKTPKTYLVQVEGVPDEAALVRLRKGVELNDGITRPAQALAIETRSIWERDPPIRVRKSVPDTWIALTTRSGRNRQVRRMTAAVGYPTLRLVRLQPLGGIDIEQQP
jgi:23S rRNA pseudouridine2457 synthase